MITWTLSNTAAFFYSKLLESPYSKILKKIDKKQMEQILEEYNVRFQNQLEQVTQEEELDWEGLRAFTERELFQGFIESLLADGVGVRKALRVGLLEKAYEESHAVTKQQMRIVERYVNSVIDFFDTFTEQKLSIEQQIQMNLLEESLVEEVHRLEAQIRKKMNEWSMTLASKNSFAYMIDQIQPKSVSQNAFHYLNEDIGFWGREEEMNALEAFLQDERAVLYTGIVAPGGCGKSKLVYEFIRSKRYDTRWEMVYLDGAQINRLMEFPDYCYPRNLLLVVDYAGLYATRLGKWLVHLLSIGDTARPEKIRLILLERAGAVQLQGMEIPPAWRSDIEAAGEQKAAIQQIWYIQKPFSMAGELRPLDDESVKRLMAQYGQRSGHPIQARETDQLLQCLKNKGNDELLKASPLMALFVTDAYIKKRDVFSWNLEGMLDHCLERFHKQWEYLCGNDGPLLASVENLMFYATAVGDLDLESEGPEYLKEDLASVQKLDDKKYMALICGVNQENTYTGILNPMEPDIVGELFLLRKLQEMAPRKKKFREMLEVLWECPQNFFSTLARCIRDYGQYAVFADFFVKENLAPLSEDSSDIRIEGCSRLLHLMLITLRGKRRQDAIAAKLKELYHSYPRHPVVAGDYAASLMLEYKNHIVRCWEQEENVEEINRLRQAFPESEYLVTIYGKSLYNQIVGYSELMGSARNGETRQACKDEIRNHLREMKELCLHYPKNQQIVKSYIMARGISGMLDKIEDIKAYTL